MTSYYGGFYSSTFSEIYPTYEAWQEDYNLFKESLPYFGDFKNNQTVKMIYYALASQYAFSHHIGSKDQWRLMMWSRVMEYGRFFERELEVQKDILGLSIEDLKQGSKAIYNTAHNPGTAPSTNSLEELEYINQQSTTNYKKSKLEGYALLMNMLNKDLVYDFVNKFKNLFIQVCYPDYPLLYVNDPELTSTEGD